MKNHDTRYQGLQHAQTFGRSTQHLEYAISNMCKERTLHTLIVQEAGRLKRPPDLPDVG
jgi:hypothetical protein